MGWLSKLKSVGSSIVGGAADGIDAVADAAEDVTEAITEAPGALIDGAVKYGSGAALSTLDLAEFVVDLPGDAVGWTGGLTADVVGGAVGLVSSDAGDSVSDTIQGGTDFVEGALHIPGDIIGAVSDLIPDPFEEDEVGTDQAELTQLTAPTPIPEGVMTAAVGVVGEATESSIGMHEDTAPTKQEIRDAAREPIIQTGVIGEATEAGHGMHEDTAPATEPTIESSTAIVDGERVAEVLERAGEDVVDQPVQEVIESGPEGVGDFGSGAVESETALIEARVEAAAPAAEADAPEESPSDLFADPTTPDDELAVDEPLADGLLDGVADFVGEATEAVGDAIDAVTDFVEDLFDGE
jgi:hypothetical protein